MPWRSWSAWSGSRTRVSVRTPGVARGLRAECSTAVRRRVVRTTTGRAPGGRGSRPPGSGCARARAVADWPGEPNAPATRRERARRRPRGLPAAGARRHDVRGPPGLTRVVRLLRARPPGLVRVVRLLRARVASLTGVGQDGSPSSGLGGFACRGWSGWSVSSGLARRGWPGRFALFGLGRLRLPGLVGVVRLLRARPPGLARTVRPLRAWAASPAGVGRGGPSPPGSPAGVGQDGSPSSGLGGFACRGWSEWSALSGPGSDLARRGRSGRFRPLQAWAASLTGVGQGGPPPPGSGGLARQGRSGASPARRPSGRRCAVTPAGSALRRPPRP